MPFEFSPQIFFCEFSQFLQADTMTEPLNTLQPLPSPSFSALALANEIFDAM